MSGSVLSLLYGLSHKSLIWFISHLISQTAYEPGSTIIIPLNGEEEGHIGVIYLAQDAQVVSDGVSSASHLLPRS